MWTNYLFKFKEFLIKVLANYFWLNYKENLLMEIKNIIEFLSFIIFPNSFKLSLSTKPSVSFWKNNFLDVKECVKVPDFDKLFFFNSSF